MKAKLEGNIVILNPVASKLTFHSCEDITIQFTCLFRECIGFLIDLEMSVLDN